MNESKKMALLAVEALEDKKAEDRYQRSIYSC